MQDLYILVYSFVRKLFTWGSGSEYLQIVWYVLALMIDIPHGHVNGIFYFTGIPWHLNHTRMFNVDQVKMIICKEFI